MCLWTGSLQIRGIISAVDLVPRLFWPLAKQKASSDGAFMKGSGRPYATPGVGRMIHDFGGRAAGEGQQLLISAS